MYFRVVYCNHESAELRVRERLALASEEVNTRAYGEFRQRFPHAEFVVISTCNRVELYAAAEDAEALPSKLEVAQVLAETTETPLDDFFDVLHERCDEDAIRHLFQVASSLDSMVLGEAQIVNQVKHSYHQSRTNNCLGPLTHALFQTAMRVAGRVRTETLLSEGKISIASVAVGDFGRSIFDSFDDKKVLVIGAGEMAEDTLRYLQDAGATALTVINRSIERAQRLSETWGGTFAAYERLDDYLGQADVVVSATGATEPIVTAEQMKRIRKQHGRRTVFILDLGTPRDISPDVGDVDDNIFLYDIDSLEQTCLRNRKKRSKEIDKAKEIVESSIERFMQELHHRTSAPIVKRLRDEWHEISRQELSRLHNKLQHLDESDLKQIERSVERIVNKLLHPPLEAIRDHAKEGPPHGLIDTVKRLFHLGD